MKHTDIYDSNITYKKLFDIFHSTRFTHKINLEPDLVYDVLKLLERLWNENPE